MTRNINLDLCYFNGIMTYDYTSGATSMKERGKFMEIWIFKCYLVQSQTYFYVLLYFLIFTAAVTSY